MRAIPTHVSVRLFWHDSGWNGSICRDPAANVWCEAHEHVRDHKDVSNEVANAGKPVAQCPCPGCEVSIQAFAPKRNKVRIWPPDWMEGQGVSPVDVSMAKTSSGMWPYEEMWGREDGSYKSNEERRAVAEQFFDEVEPGKSLAFFYVDERNPLFIDAGERSPHRVLVGISRITKLDEIEEWAEPTSNGETNMIWSVPFEHAYPADGIRLPVQAILNAESDPDLRAEYLVALNGNLRTDFRYGSSAVSHDRCVAVVEKAIAGLSRLESAGIIDVSVQNELEWLNDVLLELWEERGPYPGLAPVLSAFRCHRAAEIATRALPEIVQQGRDAAAVIFEALDGNVAEELRPYEDDLIEAQDEWQYASDPEKGLAKLLARFAITREQAQIALGEELRQRHGLPQDAAELERNPYLLCEAYIPKKDQESISFLTIDHGLVPHESMTRLDSPMSQRDPRRLRALLMEVLRDAADEGHTFFDAAEALERATALSPEDRPCDVPFNRLEHANVRPVLEESLDLFELNDRLYLALKSIRDDELLVSTKLDELVARPRLPKAEVDWQRLAEEVFVGDGADAVALSAEQVAALERTLLSPLGVITGAAGTGKSTLLGPLIAAIRHESGQVPIRAVTPTGKAADRLKDLGVEATTIHRALAQAKWYDWELGIAVEGEPIEVNTVIIDESSMVDIELLATLFRAIDWHAIERLVFVGDHHQLPPIGAGRPFFDLISTMQQADESTSDNPFRERLGELTHNYRVDAGSIAISLANGFARRAEPDDPVIWEGLARGRDQNDLRVRFWQDPEELHQLILDEIGQLAADAYPDLEPNYAFNALLGHGEGGPGGPSYWQIIAPMRDAAPGTRKLNAVIQDHFHGWAKRVAKHAGGAIKRWPVKLGAEQVTAFDKVMQKQNERLPVYRVGLGKEKGDREPVFNGQIGLVTREFPPANTKYRKGQRGPVRSVTVEFEGLPDMRFDFEKAAVDKYLELAYATTVHKAQGSQFRHVFFVLPLAAADFFGRELTYTGLTRAQDTLTLFLERDIGALSALRKRAAAKTPQRNSRLFAPHLGNEPWRAGGRKFGTTGNDLVASKSEVIIADVLEKYREKGQLTYEYEKELPAPSGDAWDFRLPDFTIHAGGKTFYWEHCGMLDDDAYRQRWETVRLPWYKRNGFEDQLIVTMDGPSDPIDSGKIEREQIRDRILGLAGDE